MVLPVRVFTKICIAVGTEWKDEYSEDAMGKETDVVVVEGERGC
jgi:hypothetical protein